MTRFPPSSLLASVVSIISLAACHMAANQEIGDPDAIVRGEGQIVSSLNGKVADGNFPVIAASALPDVCTILTKAIAAEGLESDVDELTSSPHACDYYSVEPRTGDQEVRSMNLAVMHYSFDQFSSAGADGSLLGDRLKKVTIHDRFDFLGESEAGLSYLADDGATTNLLIVPRISIIGEGADLPTGEAVIYAQLDNQKLGLAGRKVVLVPVTQKLAMAVKNLAQDRETREGRP